MRHSEVENVLLDEMVVNDHLDLISDNISEDTLFDNDEQAESIFEDAEIEQYIEDNSLF